MPIQQQPIMIRSSSLNPRAPTYSTDPGGAIDGVARERPASWDHAHPDTHASTAGITAKAGGGQASGTLLTTVVNGVSTVATAADSIRLPASDAGRVIYVVNRSANALQVFGSGSDTINGAAAATGVSQAAGKVGIYVCDAAGAWFGGVLS